jgi:hypothetical protein
VASFVIVGLMLAMFVYGAADDGLAAREVAAGGGVTGTFTLESRVEEHYGKPPSLWFWKGTFRSDDGTVVRTVRMEPLPGEDNDSAYPSGGWNRGDRVAARWIARTPDQGYLRRTRTFRYWVESMVFVGVCVLGGGIVWLLVRRYRRRHADDPPGSPLAYEPPPPPEPTERDRMQARLASTRQGLDDLRRELDRIRAGRS